MVGLQSTVFKEKLKTKLNGVVNYETWVPSPKLLAPAASFFKIYQERARAEGIDPLGYYLGGWGYAYFQLLGEAIEGAKTLDDEKLADYCTATTSRPSWVTSSSVITASGEAGVAAGTVSRHHRCGESRNLARHELSDGTHAGGPENRRADLSLRQSEVTPFSSEHFRHLSSQISELILEMARGNCAPRVDRFRREAQILAATEKTRWKHCRKSASRAPT